MVEISVNIPAHNAEKYIEECLGSFIQSEEAMEILVLDDGSTDSTAQIVKNVSKRDPRVKLLQFEINKGVAAGRQYLLENSQGKYIMPFDADDILIPSWISLAKSKLDENPDLPAVYGKCCFMTEAGVPTGKVHGSTFSRINCQVCHPVPQGSVFARKEVFLNSGGYIPTAKEGPNVLEDFFTWCRMMINYEMHFIDSFAFFYRDHGDQMTKKTDLFENAMAFIQNFIINQNKTLTQNIIHDVYSIPEIQADRNLTMFIIGTMLKESKMTNQKAIDLLNFAEAIDPKDYGVYIKKYEYFKSIGRSRAALSTAKRLAALEGLGDYPVMIGHFLLMDFYESKEDLGNLEHHKIVYEKYLNAYTDYLDFHSLN